MKNFSKLSNDSGIKFKNTLKEDMDKIDKELELYRSLWPDYMKKNTQDKLFLIFIKFIARQDPDEVKIAVCDLLTYGRFDSLGELAGYIKSINTDLWDKIESKLNE